MAKFFPDGRVFAITLAPHGISNNILLQPTFRIFGGGSSIFLRRPAELHRGVNRAAVGDVY
jgi:hypothetical protein